MAHAPHLILSLLVSGLACAAVSERECFDFGWQFRYFGSGNPAQIGSPATADSAQGGHEAACAIDSRLDTRWCATSSKEGHWFQLVPGVDRPAKELRIDWEKPNNMRVRCEYIADGKAESTEFNVGGQSASRLPLGGRCIRELKLTLYGTDQRHWAGAREITLIDTEGKPIVPRHSADAYRPASPDYSAQEDAELTRTLGLSGFAARGFREVQLPHDWAIESPFLAAEPNETGKLPWNGWGWYRKQFTLPADFNPDTERRYLDFDGVMSNPKIYVNGQLAGEWAYGYNSFRVDITPYLQPGKNLVAVMASNLPLSTRWYPGAGIYRHVWMVKKPTAHIEQWGVRVTTPDIREDSADVCVETTLVNTGKTPIELQVCNSVGSVRTKPLSLPLAPGERRSVTQTLTLPSPKLWSTEHPHLYTLNTEILRDGQVQDSQSTPFGVRRIAWKADGFYLNGKRVPLKGVCEHHDLGALGAAFHSDAFERKIRILKEMGCNSIRTAHNPPAPELLDLCDKHGMLVIDELFDIWKFQKYDKINGYHLYWPQWWQKDVRNFVLRDRNHPCIIAWSGGNEVPELEYSQGVAVSAALREEFRKYDTTRPYTVGANTTSLVDTGFVNTVDVAGFNYRPFYYNEFRQRCPEKPVYGSETDSCVATRNWYHFPFGWNVGNGAAEHQVSSYGTAAPHWGNCPDVEFAAQDAAPFVAGEYVWTGFDYLGEPTPYNQDRSNEANFKGMSAAERNKALAELRAMGKCAPSRSSYFGIIDLAGFPKDIYYLFQSRWRPELPQAHILPHWNWPGREGQVTPVMVYSSGDEAELFLNGRSLGVRRRGEGDTFTQRKITLPKNAYRFVWEDVRYEPGTLKVVVKKNGKPWAEATRSTAGECTELKAKVENATLKGDGHALAFIELTAVDRQGIPVPTENRRVRFRASGPICLAGFCNGDPTDATGLQEPQQKLFNGKLLAIVRSLPGSEGTGTLTVEAEGLPALRIPIRITPAAAR